MREIHHYNEFNSSEKIFPFLQKSAKAGFFAELAARHQLRIKR
jgi:hypothetical protein